MSRAAKLVVDNLINNLKEHPEDFTCGKYRLNETTTGFEYWIGNSFFDAGIYEPYNMSFGWVQGWRFHAALERWKAHTNINAKRTGEK